MSAPFAQLDLALVDLIARFNLYVLPAVVALVVLGAGLRKRPADGALDRLQTIRWIGLLNYGLALRAVLRTVPEWVAYIRYGAFASLMIVSVAWPLLTAALHIPIGLGVRRLRPWARWAEVIWCALLSALSLMVTFWLGAHGAAFDLASWPDLAVAQALPVWMLVVMLLPRTARVFAAESWETAPGPPTRPSVVSLVTLGFLVVLGAVVVVNAADRLIRLGATAAGVPEAL